MNDQSIAITGMACVFPGARNLEEYWRNIVNGVDAVTDIPAGRLNGIERLALPEGHEAHIACRRGGFLPPDIKFDAPKYGIMPNIVANGDPDQFLMLEVAASALADAGIGAYNPLRETTDVIIGRGGYCTNKFNELFLRSEACDRILNFVGRAQEGLPSGYIENVAAQLRAALPPIEADSLSTCIPNLAACRVANRLDLHGAAYVVDSACSSSLLAIEQAVTRLRANMCDIVVAGGIHLYQSPGFWLVFSSLGAFSHSSVIRPFDRRADGLVPAEGCGAIILKRTADAIRDGDRIYAIIRGSGTASDGREAAVLAPASAGQVRAMKRAYKDAGVDPASIGYLEAHGTGTQIGDATEIETIRKFFGGRGRFAGSRGMGSVKSMIGHAMPAAGIASVIKTALALNHKILPPSLNCEEPRPELDDSPFFVVGQTRPWIHQSGIDPRRAGVNAFGFGGSNTHVVLEEVPESSSYGPTTARPRPTRDHRKFETEIFTFSGETSSEVTEKLDQIEARIESAPWTEPVELARSLVAQWRVEHPVKLSCVAADLAALKGMLSRGKEIVEQGEEFFNKDGWYFTPNGNTPKGKVACIFPGIGFPGLIGNYPDHLMEVCLHFPEVREQFDAIELRDRHPEDPVPTSVIFAPPHNLNTEQQTLLRARIAPIKVIDSPDEEIDVPPVDRNIAAPCITLTNWVSWLLLQRLGVQAHMVCGQSNGEMAALCACGILSWDEIVLKLWESLSFTPTYAGKGRLAFVHGSEAKLAEFTVGLETVGVAIHVAPQALVVGGVGTEIDELLRRLREAQVLSQSLPYPPIHTSQLSYFRDEIAHIFNADVTFSPRNIQIYSAVTESVFPDNEADIRETAASNLDSPVRFWQTIERMYHDGARVFLQVGGGSLAANIKSVLEKPDIIGAAVDVDYRDPLTQLNHLCATLMTAGIPIELEGLFDNRAQFAPSATAAEAASGKPSRAMPLRFDWEALGDQSHSTKAPASNVQSSNPHKNGAPVSSAPAVLAATAVSPQAVASATANSNGASPTHAAPPSPAPQPVAVHRPAKEHSFERRMPFVDSIIEHTPGVRVVTEHVLDAYDDVFLQDHLFVHAEGVKPPERCLPVMPLTVILEAMAEAAACLAPGLGVIGFENVQAQRWVALDDMASMPFQIVAERLPDSEDGVQRIATKLVAMEKECTKAVVLVADQYRQELDIAFPPFEGVSAWPFPMEEVYPEGHLFHGPAFRCITALHEFAENGGTAELTVMPTDKLFASTPNPELVIDPVILDGIGQIVGLWASALGTSVLPSGVDKIEFYRPTPPPGTRIFLRMWVSDTDTKMRLIKSQLEAIDEDGNVWFRVVGWKDWLYRSPQSTHDFRRKPTQHCVATELLLSSLPAGSVCSIMSRSDLQDVTLLWMEKVIASVAENDEFVALRLPKLQWNWLLSRIAAKDAARTWLGRQAGSDVLVHPAAMTLTTDHAGSFHLSPLPGIAELPTLSVFHMPGHTIAVAANNPVGIALHVDLDGAAAEVAASCLPAEQALIHEQSTLETENAWPARLLAAKHAACGLPTNSVQPAAGEFAVVDCLPGGQFLVQHKATGARHIVMTERIPVGVVAYTCQPRTDDRADATQQELALAEQMIII